MNTKSDKEFQKRFIDALSPKTQEDRIQFEAEKIHLDLIFLLKEMMEKRGLNRKQLAELLGVSPSYLTQLFTGDKLINLKTIARLQEIFGVKFKIVPARETRRYTPLLVERKIDLSSMVKKTKTLAA